MTVTATATPTDLNREHKKVLTGSMVGTTIEWFDFFIYAQAAGLIFAQQYFEPLGRENASLAEIISWATLGISFLFRPLGAIIAGHLGDRIGRKPVLTLTLVGMGTATMAMGILPTYATIGITAPLFLIMLRIIQGLSAGGEWGSAAMLSVEHAPLGRRGFFGSFPQVGAPAGMALATVFMLMLSTALTPEQFESWGWRIPFLSSVFLIVLGYLVRRLIEESPAFVEMEQLKKKESAPLSTLLRSYWKTVVHCALIFAGNNAIGYFVIAYFVAYGTKQVGYSRSEALAVTLTGAIVWLLSTPLFGALSDIIGRKKLFIFGYIATILWAYPSWQMVDSGNVWLFGLGVTTVAFLQGSTYAQQPALYAEMFPVQVRLSGVSIGYALGSILGGAFAPMIAAMLLDATGTSTAIATYSIIVCIISLIAVLKVANNIQDRDLHV
ncbi:transporter [Corynebacterium kutscheri]|uniref:Transporter n=1 Tax=Corynebacterium kutscheri TaxID=35755 RepID=A0A0F6R083_9CORY|nr:MFS transporter [Corynebacterium kutscheri]AKE41577.1 Major Facilitator Superfamily transporter [Corynebacterium kutscheri]VEH08856.1 transporter [Corynebacterium kutscheri]VEH09901.1 transporter [Corynebacterium kutscheri]VEH79985.1 transporter [Corynebacterium kutscheri]